jgi:hypothetical protein
VRVGLRGCGRSGRSNKQLLCRSEAILMRGIASKFTPLKPAFWRQKNEREDEHAQNVVLPSSPIVRPENYPFECAQEHKLSFWIRAGQKKCDSWHENT